MPIENTRTGPPQSAVLIVGTSPIIPQRLIHDRIIGNGSTARTQVEMVNEVDEYDLLAGKINDETQKAHIFNKESTILGAQLAWKGAQ